MRNPIPDYASLRTAYASESNISGPCEIPGLSPGVITGVEGDWTEISNAAAQQAVYARGDGTAANALSRATGGVRSTMSFGLTFFAHSLSVGLARPVGQPGPWRWVFRIG